MRLQGTQDGRDRSGARLYELWCGTAPLTQSRRQRRRKWRCCSAMRINGHSVLIPVGGKWNPLESVGAAPEYIPPPGMDRTPAFA
jgi:hypothetical protein